jgi:hypothetical protein
MLNDNMTYCIWVDCDEVLSETIDELLKRSPLKEKWIKKTDITSYNLHEVEKIWITLEEAVSLFFWFFESQDYYKTQPVSWAYEKLYEWRQAWHKLFVVTARKKPHEDQTRKRVEAHFPWIFSDYLFMWQYTENEIPKSQLCKDKWIQVLIDDSVTNIYDMNSVWMPWFLLDKPRNQWVKDSELLHRVYSRDEININQFLKFEN